MTDEERIEVIEAKYLYEWVSEQLGPESPAKMAKLLKEQKASATAALIQLTDNIVKAKDLSQIMKYVKQATKGTSVLPDILKDTVLTDEMKQVLEEIKKEGNAEFAK
jgi:hypothetical protein